MKADIYIDTDKRVIVRLNTETEREKAVVKQMRKNGRIMRVDGSMLFEVAFPDGAKSEVVKSVKFTFNYNE